MGVFGVNYFGQRCWRTRPWHSLLWSWTSKRRSRSSACCRWERIAMRKRARVMSAPYSFKSVRAYADGCGARFLKDSLW